MMVRVQMASIHAGNNIHILLEEIASIFVWKKAIMMTMDKVVNTPNLLLIKLEM